MNQEKNIKFSQASLLAVKMGLQEWYKQTKQAVEIFEQMISKEISATNDHELIEYYRSEKKIWSQWHEDCKLAIQESRL